MIYGYARCSTNEKKQDITRQTKELKQFGVDKQNIFFEYESGTKADRPELNRLLATVKQGDTIIATEVSRITRSTKQLCDIIDFANKHRIKLVIGNSMTIDCTSGDLDAMTKAFVQIAGVFAELERNMIVDRIKSGMDNARAKGTHLGRYQTTVNDIPQSFMKYYQQYKDKQINVSELAKLCSMSRTTVYKYIKLIEEE
jgi:DNA invertase Pin-like site-specific DNA recombinase